MAEPGTLFVTHCPGLSCSVSSTYPMDTWSWGMPGDGLLGSGRISPAFMDRNSSSRGPEAELLVGAVPWLHTSTEAVKPWPGVTLAGAFTSVTTRSEP